MTRILLSFFAIAALAACPGSTPDGDADTDTGDIDADTDVPTDDADLPTGDADAATDDADLPDPLECDYPTEGHGVNPDEVLPPFRLETCDGTQTSFAALWCDNEVTVVHVSTSWCPLCTDATTLLQRDVMAHLEGQPVTLVELLVEGAEHEVIANPTDCHDWAERFAPPVATYIPPDGSIEGNLGEVFRAMPAPSTFLVDSDGVIRYRTTIVLPDRAEQQTLRVLDEINLILAE